MSQPSSGLGNSSDFVINQLKLNYDQAREQARSWFRVSLVASGVGFFLIGLSVISALLGSVAAGLLAAIASLIPDAAAALFFLQATVANRRVDEIQARLTRAREVQDYVQIVNTIKDQDMRDRVKAEIVRKIFRLTNKNV